MSDKGKAAQALSDFIARRKNQMPLVCTVDSVDLPTLTCYCIPVNGSADILGVRLMAQVSNGFLIIPEVQSTVLVGFIDDGNAYIEMFSTVQEIQLNSDTFGGLVKAGSSVTRLNNIENKVNAILNAISTTWIPVPNDGGAALKTLFVPPLSTALTTTVLADLENTTVKHGDGT